MGFGVDRLFADPADFDASSKVLSYLSSAGGTVITSTGSSLNVNVTNGISINTDGVYDAGTNTDPDNVGLIAHVRAAAPADANQTLRSTGGAASSDNVVAANVFGLDVNSFGMLYDGATWDRWLGTAGAGHVHIASQAAKLSVKASYATALFDNVAVTTTEVAIPTTALSGRSLIQIYNNGSKVIYLGQTGVTTADGWPISPGSAYEVAAEAGIALFAVAASGSQDIRYAEFAA